MISGAAFCPHPPVLVPEVATGAAPELDDVRAACRAAIAGVASGCDRLVLLGSDARTFIHSSRARGTFARFGIPLEIALTPDADGPIELPLSLTVGAWLVRDALGASVSVDAVSVAPDAAAIPIDTADARVGLVVMGDGSARRTTAAPGYLDERAVAFDDAIVAALRAGDADALASIDQGEADALLVAGSGAWRAAGSLLRGAAVDAEILYYEAPFGVAYIVAAWTVRD